MLTHVDTKQFWPWYNSYFRCDITAVQPFSHANSGFETPRTLGRFFSTGEQGNSDYQYKKWNSYIVNYNLIQLVMYIAKIRTLLKSAIPFCGCLHIIPSRHTVLPEAEAPGHFEPKHLAVSSIFKPSKNVEYSSYSIKKLEVLLKRLVIWWQKKKNRHVLHRHQFRKQNGFLFFWVFLSSSNMSSFGVAVSQWHPICGSNAVDEPDQARRPWNARVSSAQVIIPR